ncbi:hypothetical protein F2Q69_00058096 [Brassica cretica]|uniref:Uncharacterized protein n=1 Tax=Brassica cretica TaxID=69181 RepID=A0A8S9RDC2_BRACR|nr:hypothetical protein F2Q69_00058096 [Brassica cretica]
MNRCGLASARIGVSHPLETVIEFTRRKAERNHFLSFLKKGFRSERQFLVRRRPFSNFLLRIDDGVSHPRAQVTGSTSLLAQHVLFYS